MLISTLVKTALLCMILGVTLNTYADWQLSDQESKELPNQYTQAVKETEVNSFTKVKKIEAVNPWNEKLTFSANGQKILMTSVVPKWCIDSNIYVKSKSYTSPDWPAKILVDNHQRLVQETKIYKQQAHQLIKGREWTGAWIERYDSTNKFLLKRPVINQNYLKEHYGAHYAEKINHLVNKTDATVVNFSKDLYKSHRDTVVVYEDLKNSWVNQREIIQRNFNDRQVVDIKTFPEELRKKMSTQRLIWISPYPEIKNHLSTNSDDRERNLKVRQITGLPVTDKIPTQYAVDMWVDIRDLVRPCPDADLQSTVCPPSPPYAINDPELGTLKDIFAYIPRSHDLTFEIWFKSNTENAYSGKYPFPWTRLGYTYNWDVSTENKQGVTEFFLRPGATVEIANVTELKDY